MAHEKVYGICENKCRVEVPNKVEFDSANLTDTNWVDVLTTEGDYTNFDVNLNVGYRRKNGIVFLKGVIVNFDTTNSVTIATLPEGCRPTARVLTYVSCYASGALDVTATVEISINTSGVITMTKKTGDTSKNYNLIYLSGISFPC